jgi:hypothetical protein
MSFSSMCNDVVTLVKSDGTVIEKIKSNVQPNMIFIFDSKLPIEEMDKIYRPLPNGLVEKYVVVDRGFYSAVNGIQAHYQIKVQKESSIQSDQFQQITNIYNLNGAQSKINIQSTDNSINMIKESDELFDKIIKVLNDINDQKVKDDAIIIVNDMRENIGKPVFKEKYQSFISTLANYITIIGPFIPALTALL